MAAEAVLKVSEAEEKGGELLRQAGEDAREIVKKAEADGELSRKAILNEARQAKENAVKAAGDKANRECADMARLGGEEAGKLPGPGDSRFEKAVALIIERIVNSIDS